MSACSQLNSSPLPTPRGLSNGHRKPGCLLLASEGKEMHGHCMGHCPWCFFHWPGRAVAGHAYSPAPQAYSKKVSRQGCTRNSEPSWPVWGHLAWRKQPWGTPAPEVSQPLFVRAHTQPGVPCPPAVRPGSRLCSASELPSWGARHTAHVTCLAFEGQGTWETKDRKAGHWDGTRTPPCLQSQTLAWPPICLASVMMRPAPLQMVCNCPWRQGLLWGEWDQRLSRGECRGQGRHWGISGAETGVAGERHWELGDIRSCCRRT